MALPGSVGLTKKLKFQNSQSPNQTKNETMRSTLYEVTQEDAGSLESVEKANMGKANGQLLIEDAYRHATNDS